MTLVEFFTKMQEKLTGYLGIIDSDHAYVHRSKKFKLVGNTTIASGGTYKITFTTPDVTKPQVKASGQMYIHWRPALIYGTAGGLAWVLYRDSTGVSGGTAATPRNSNAVNPKSSNMSVLIGTTVTGNGTVVDNGASGTAGNPATAAGGGSGASQEELLAANTVYTLVITNLYAGDNPVYYNLPWYEEDNYKG